MRIIGVVSQLGFPPGLYIREGIDKKVTEDAWQKYATSAFGAKVAVVMLFPLGLGIPAVLLWEYIFNKKVPPIQRLETAILTEKSTPQLPNPAIYLPASGLLRKFSDFKEGIFHGLFQEEKELRTIMEAEGGNSELLILDQETANQTFTHAGGGTFSIGQLHIPHPKDISVLVPIESYSEYLKTELQAEWVSILSALGAKHIVIADATKATVKTTGDGTTVAGSVALEMRASYGASNVEESFFGTGVFEPTRAVANRRWLGDHPVLLSIIEGRIHGQQLSWRKTVKVNISFGASVEVLSTVHAAKVKTNVETTYERVYDFYVEFHPRSEAKTKRGPGLSKTTQLHHFTQSTSDQNETKASKAKAPNRSEAVKASKAKTQSKKTTGEKITLKVKPSQPANSCKPKLQSISLQ
jgi:hypothetical protein